MQGREDQMSGKSCFDNGIGGFHVPGLTDHDHIGIGPEKGPQDPGEIQADLWQDLDLPETVLDDLVKLFVALDCGVTFQAEYAWFDRDFDDAGEMTTVGWYAQAGYLLPGEIGPGRLEIAGRIEELDPDDDASDDSVRGYSIGLNYYLVGHNLKIQTDLTFLDPDEGDNEQVFHIQLQLDF